MTEPIQIGWNSMNDPPTPIYKDENYARMWDGEKFVDTWKGNMSDSPVPPTPDKCPICGAETCGIYTSMTGGQFVEYGCGSRFAEIENRQSDKCHISELTATVARLTSKIDSLTGWYIAKECDDGSLLLESTGGARRHVWNESVQLEKSSALLEQVERLTREIERLMIERRDREEPGNFVRAAAECQQKLIEQDKQLAESQRREAKLIEMLKRAQEQMWRDISTVKLHAEIDAALGGGERQEKCHHGCGGAWDAVAGTYICGSTKTERSTRCFISCQSPRPASPPQSEDENDD